MDQAEQVGKVRKPPDSAAYPRRRRGRLWGSKNRSRRKGRMAEEGRLEPFSRGRRAVAGGWKGNRRSCASALLGIGLPDQGERHAGWIAGSGGPPPCRHPRGRCTPSSTTARGKRRKRPRGTARRFPITGLVPDERSLAMGRAGRGGGCRDGMEKETHDTVPGDFRPPRLTPVNIPQKAKRSL